MFAVGGRISSDAVVAVPRIWNSLPDDMSSFHRRLKTFLFNNLMQTLFSEHFAVFFIFDTLVDKLSTVYLLF